MIHLLAFGLVQSVSGTLIHGGLVYDGTGRPPVREDVRIVGNSIRAVGRLKPLLGERVVDAAGLAVAPGFIDAHSHADGGIFEDSNAETQIRQGITTAVVGEDGSSTFPVKSFFDHLQTTPASINFASFVGHGTLRGKVIGMADRASTPAERNLMANLVQGEMRDGALGLSTGLEYEPGRFGNTEELIPLAKAAGDLGGMYISHVRNEDNQAFAAFQELETIAREGHLPAQINHIKLCSTRVWHRAGEVLKMMQDEARRGVQISADVYPYTYWQSTIRVIISTEDFDDRAQWAQGISDVGGPENILLTEFSPDPTWKGKTIAEISKMTGKDPITVIQDVVERCYRHGNSGREGVVVRAMSEDDVQTFVASPRIMFCSDGGLHGTHPRGAGSFPRILGVYVRERHVLPLTEAIRKMTSLPAKRFGFTDRGRIARGMKADLVLFDPATVKDTATTKDPESKPIGIPTVFVNGIEVLSQGNPTNVHPGTPLSRKVGK